LSSWGMVPWERKAYPKGLKPLVLGDAFERPKAEALGYLVATATTKTTTTADPLRG
jgi:hypothetical protein